MEMLLGIVVGVAFTAAFYNKDKVLAYVKSKLDKATLNK